MSASELTISNAITMDSNDRETNEIKSRKGYKIEVRQGDGELKDSQSETTKKYKRSRRNMPVFDGIVTSVYFNKQNELRKLLQDRIEKSSSNQIKNLTSLQVPESNDEVDDDHDDIGIHNVSKNHLHTDRKRSLNGIESNELLQINKKNSVKKDQINPIKINGKLMPTFLLNTTMNDKYVKLLQKQQKQKIGLLNDNEQLQPDEIEQIEHIRQHFSHIIPHKSKNYKKNRMEQEKFDSVSDTIVHDNSHISSTETAHHDLLE
jgi:hypothetical protein